MRIRTKLLSLVILVAGGFILIAGLSVQTYLRLDSIKGAIEGGQRLVSQAQRAQGLLKDLVFDLFGSRLYSSLQGVVFSPGSSATERAWIEAVNEFRVSYEAYMADPAVRGLLIDPELKDAWTVAAPMSERAFKELADLRVTVDLIRAKYPDGDELYSRVQLSKDESLYAVFDRLRSSSFYLGNIFESYLNRFVTGLERQSKATERSILLAYALSSLLVIGIAVILVLLVTRSVAVNIALVEGALGRLAEGDFSFRVEPQGSDETGRLAKRLNQIGSRLKSNVDSLAALLADVNLAAPDEPDLDRTLAIVTDALLRDRGAECAAIYLLEGGEGTRSSWSGFDPFPGAGTGAPALALRVAATKEVLVLRDLAGDSGGTFPEGIDPAMRSLVIAPLAIRRRVSGVCLFGLRSRPFNDLEIAQLVSFADYAAQVIDNVVAQAGLLARRDAGFAALQAQVQPHFLYNVLNSLVALNRMEARDRLESSLHALKDLFRYSLGKEGLATVAEEAAFIEAYCGLQGLRFEGRLSWKIDVDPSVASLRIPRLIIQPLVENAIIHGVEPLERTVEVRISATAEAGFLVIRIDDDGAGCDPGLIREKERVGLGNIRERLALLYVGATLCIEGKSGGGFSVVIRIPLAAAGRP